MELVDRWAEFHEKALPYEQVIIQEPFKTLVAEIVDFSRENRFTELLESGFGTGYVMFKLKELGFNVNGIESSEILLNRFLKLAFAKKLDIGTAKGDVFNKSIYEHGTQEVIYHQGFLEHLENGDIETLLTIQKRYSTAVIFSVPAIAYGRQDFGDERLLSLEGWQAILEGFELLRLCYYDDKKHILGIVKGDLYVSRSKAGSVKYSL